MVQHDDVAFLPVDMFEPLHTLPPAGRDGEEGAHQDARQLVHHAAALVEGIAHDQRQGRQDHEEGAQQHQEDIINRAYHSFSIFCRAFPPPVPACCRIASETAWRSVRNHIGGQ